MTAVEMIESLDDHGDHIIGTVEVTPGVIDRTARQVYGRGQCFALAVALARRTGWPVMLVAAEGYDKPTGDSVGFQLLLGFTDDATGERSDITPIHVLLESHGLTPDQCIHAVAVSPDREFTLDIIGLREFAPGNLTTSRRAQQYAAMVDPEDLVAYLDGTPGAALNYELADTFAVTVLERAGMPTHVSTDEEPGR